MDKRTMICGLDVFHEQESCQLSCLGFVASYNKTCTKFWPAHQLMPSQGEEVSTLLKSHVLEALRHFYEANGAYPERVILFRDSIPTVSNAVLQATEVKGLVEACASLDVKCLYCLVTRSAHVEVYAQGFYTDSYKNAIPGTVLSQGVTQSRDGATEFYLISSSQRQGFANPSKYTVLHDSTGEPLHKLHQLSYKLCHNYFNIANPVKAPSPILYARKLAKFMAERSKVVTQEQNFSGALFNAGVEANYSRSGSA